MARRGKVAVSITADSTGLKKGVRDAEGSLDRFGKRGSKSLATLGAPTRHLRGELVGIAKAAGGAAAAYASVAGAKKAVDVTEELAKTTLSLQRNLGLSTKAASEFAGVAKVRGIESKALVQTFGTLSKQFVGLGDGSKKATDAFKRLGITQKDLAGQNFEQKLGTVADAFGKMRGGAQRSALGMQLFGRGWQTLLPLMSKGSKGLNEQLQLADKYGVTFKGKTVKSLQDLIAAQRESKFATLGLQVAFGTMLAPALTKAIKAASGFVREIREGTGAGGRFADKLKEIADRIRPIVKFFTDHPKLIAVAVGAWATYRVASVAALAASRLKLIGMFAGLGPKAAAGGAVAGRSFGGAAATSAGTTFQRRAPGVMGGGRMAGAMRGVGTAMGAVIGPAMVIAATAKFSIDFNKWLKQQPWYKPPGGKDSFFDDLIPDSFLPKKKPGQKPGGLLGALGVGKEKPPNRSKQTPFKPSTPLGTLPKARTSAVAHTSSVRGTAARGPVRVAGATTAKRQQALALMQRMWKAAAPQYGRAGKPMPRVKFTGSSDPMVGMVWNSDATKVGSAQMYWPDWMTDWLLGLGKPGDRDAAFATILHEWAHYFQVTGLSESDAEGGAQAFARRIAPGVAGAVGVPYRNQSFGSEQYQGPISRVKRRGETFITSGQFRGGGAKATTARAASKGGGGDFVSAVEREASRIDAAHVPYQWGGGHGGRATPGGKVIPMDCSGAVSAVLGIDPRVSGDFVTWGSPGDGGSSGITIYANRTHVLMKINGRFWGTSRSNPGGGAGWIDGGVSPGYLSGFTARHMESTSSTSSALSGAAGAPPRPKTLTAKLGGVVSRVTGTALGGKTPKVTGPMLFSPSLRPADPSAQAKLIRQLTIAGRIIDIKGAIAAGKIKNPATMQRLGAELEDLAAEQKDLAAPPEKPTGTAGVPGADAYLASIDKDAALASLTAGNADDIEAAKKRVGAAESILTYEQQQGFGDADVADAANNLKSARDALEALTSAVNENTQQLLDIEKQRSKDVQRALNVSQSQYGTLAKAIADVANGQLGGRLGLGFQTPSFSGGVARP